MFGNRVASVGKHVAVLVATAGAVIALDAPVASANGCGVTFDGATYFIDDASDFVVLDTCDPTMNFVLVDDVDLTGVIVSPLLDFTGVFDGQGHTISNLTVSGGGLFDVGASGAEFTRIDIRNSVVEAFGGNGWSGALVRDAFGPVAISSSNFTGRVESKVGGNAFAGGFVGFAWDDVTISDSYVTGQVIGGADGNGWAGGFIGNVDGFLGGSDVSIERSYVSGSVQGGSDGNTWAAGFIGNANFADVAVVDSFVRASLTGGSGPNSWVNGFIGSAGPNGQFTVTRSYFEGSLTTGIGVNSWAIAISDVSPWSVVSDSSFCVESCSSDVMVGGTGTEISNNQIRSRNFLTDAGWNFRTVWCSTSRINDGYPALRTIDVGPENTRNCRRSHSHPGENVTFETNGGSCTWGGVVRDGAWSVSFRSSLSLPTADDCTRPGYRFVGWSAAGSSSGSLVAGPVTRSVSLVAVWEAITPPPSTAPQAFVLANFFCGPCDSLVLFWAEPAVPFEISVIAPPPPSTTAVVVRLNGIETACGSLVTIGDLKVCTMSGLTPGQQYEVSVAFRNAGGIGPAFTRTVVLA